MTTQRDSELLASYFRQLTGLHPGTVTALRPHASERRMYRLRGGSVSLVGVINPVRRENDAFVAFAETFAAMGIPVPKVHVYSADDCLYLEDDLGDETLFDLLAAERSRTGEPFPARVESLYKRCMEWLPRFQIECAQKFDFSLCYPEQHLLPGTFSRDCTSFATELVTRLLPSFDITRLASDFAALIAYLEQSPASYFVYRDFQSRNIMICDENPYFIDFQSGCQGPLQYDVVSLLYQSSTQLPADVRNRLAQHYCDGIAHRTDVTIEDFHRFYAGFIISRMVQVLGVYGRQGLGAGKSYFTKSIPMALATLSQEITRPECAIKLPALRACVERLIDALALGTQI
jgi:aminoglycoside/choline kinase family phosphotransferase